MKIGNLSADQLESFVKRIERLDQDKANLLSDIRDVYAEASANGFDKRTIREIIKLRKLDQQERDERQYQLDLYTRALGMAPELEDVA